MTERPRYIPVRLKFCRKQLNIRKEGLQQALKAGTFPEFSRTGAGYFFELAVEMNFAGIAAGLRNPIDGKVAGEEIVFGVINPHKDQVMAKGNTENLLI